MSGFRVYIINEKNVFLLKYLIIYIISIPSEPHSIYQAAYRHYAGKPLKVLMQNMRPSYNRPLILSLYKWFLSHELRVIAYTISANNILGR